MKTFTKGLAIKEMKIKITRTYHYTPTRMVKIKRPITPNWSKDADHQTFLIHSWQEGETVEP